MGNGDTLDEDDAQRRLERLQVAHAGQADDVGHDDGEKAVEAHAGRHGKGLVGRERHDERADGGGNARGEEHAVPELRATSAPIKLPRGIITVEKN